MCTEKMERLLLGGGRIRAGSPRVGEGATRALMNRARQNRSVLIPARRSLAGVEAGGPVQDRICALGERTIATLKTGDC